MTKRTTEAIRQNNLPQFFHLLFIFGQYNVFMNYAQIKHSGGKGMRILVVEDEQDLNRVIVKKLKIEGYSVDACYDGREALDYLAAADYDVVLLDILLPGKNGYEVLAYIRRNKSQTPVLFLTAKDAPDDRIAGLDLGADDYLVKPFHFGELMARIRAMVRRNYGGASNQLQLADLVLNSDTHKVTRAGAAIELSAKEFSMLEYLMQNQGIVLSRRRLEEHLWDFEYQGASNMIDVYIRYLRLKIDKPCQVKLIHTVRGVGYVLREGDGA